MGCGEKAFSFGKSHGVGEAPLPASREKGSPLRARFSVPTRWRVPWPWSGGCRLFAAGRSRPGRRCQGSGRRSPVAVRGARSLGSAGVPGLGSRRRRAGRPRLGADSRAFAGRSAGQFRNEGPRAREGPRSSGAGPGGLRWCLSPRGAGCRPGRRAGAAISRRRRFRGSSGGDPSHWGGHGPPAGPATRFACGAGAGRTPGHLPRPAGAAARGREGGRRAARRRARDGALREAGGDAAAPGARAGTGGVPGGAQVQGLPARSHGDAGCGAAGLPRGPMWPSPPVPGEGSSRRR